MNDCAMLTMSSIRSVQPQMFAMTDHLVGIERKHWQTLRDFYSPKSPETYLSYSLLDYYIRWSEREPESVDIVFYSLNGDWSDGSFVAIWELQNECSLSEQFGCYTEGIMLKSIAQSDVHKIDEVHTLGLPGSLQTFRNMVKFNPCVGAFNTEGQMIAWALRWPFGGIAALKVDDNYQRRGLGALVTKATSRKIAETGHDVYAGISLRNAASQAMFEKLGFTRVPNVQWLDVQTSPAN